MYSSKFKWKFPLTPSDVCNNKPETTDPDYGEKHAFLRSNLKFCYLEMSLECQRCLVIKHSFKDVRFDNLDKALIYQEKKTNTRISQGF